MTENAHTTPAYRLGVHPRRNDHPALLHDDGRLALTFALDASRAEIIEKLLAGGLILHADDTVTM